jgi:hypothetical protein
VEPDLLCLLQNISDRFIVFRQSSVLTPSPVGFRISKPVHIRDRNSHYRLQIRLYLTYGTYFSLSSGQLRR